MKYKLQDLIDMDHFQGLQDRLNEIYSFPSSIIDNQGNILTATAWQDICTQFHRKHKACEKLCVQSDQYIKDHIHQADPAVTYRCPHGLVDNATPIIIGGVHYGNFFTGQFFLEEPDMKFFRAQAGKYGFDEDAYLEAVKRVPIWTQKQLDSYLFFIKGLITIISESGLKKLKEIENRKQIESSEKRHKSILKSAMDGYWLTDAQGQLIEVNDAYCQMSGYSESELLKMHISDLEALENPQRVAEHMQRVISQGSDRFESQHRRKDGTVFSVESNTQFRAGEEGLCVSFIRDITHQKEVEADLLQQKQFLQRAQEIGKIGTWELDIEKNELLWTEENYKIFGVPIGTKLTYELFLDCVHPDDQDYVDTEWKAAFTGKPYDITHRLVVDGKTKWVREKAELIFNKKGECVKGTGFTQDIDEQKRYEIEKIKEKQKAERYLNLAKVMFIGLDKEGNVNLANKKASEILKIQQKDVIGQNWFDNFIPQNIRHEVYLIFKQIIDGDIDPVEYHENIIVTKEGSEKQIAWHNTVLKGDDGSIIGVLSSGEDITEKRQLQVKLQQAQKMESIGTLAGGIAHDFNNILSSILGFTELALGGVPKGSDLEDDLQEVRAAGIRAKDLVKQILTFARQADEKIRPLQVSVLAREVLKFLKSSIPSTIQISEKIDSESFIMGSPIQIHQVLMNLCTNAAQIMEEKGGRLEVCVTDTIVDTMEIPDLKAGEYIQIRVTDTGMGIPPHHIHAIFEPYFTTKPVGEGTGMGLAVAHGVVENYGGKITVDSTFGKGTCFTVYLPITKKRREHKHFKKENLPLGNETILFVDDEAPIVKIGKKILEQLGYSVTTRTNSIDALELFQSRPEAFDLVITDMTMPNMTGEKLAIEVMKTRPDIPVVLCTGYSKKIYEESAAQIGIKSFVYKPIVMADLATTVRNVLDKAIRF